MYYLWIETVITARLRIINHATPLLICDTYTLTLREKGERERERGGERERRGLIDCNYIKFKCLLTSA